MKRTMSVEDKNFPRVKPVGDTALLIELGSEITTAVNDRVHALDVRIKDDPLRGVIEWVPAYASMLVIYDPMSVEILKVQRWLQECLKSLPGEGIGVPKKVRIPVKYGAEDGPDMAFVAEYHHLSPEEVVRRHTAGVYRVGMMGFTPGFAYLMGLDPGLATPRLETPRTQVPAGAVGIAGNQTGIYPLASPGGWRLIGRTEIKLFDPEVPPHFLLSPGDQVQFVALGEGDLE
jgi:KipI family sensor histidine kinase inhibitor